MKSSTWKRLLALLGACMVGLAQGDLSGADFKASIATRIVTPDPLLPVSGGVGPSHPVSTKKGELTVRVLALELGKTRTAIISTDFLGFPAVLGDRIRNATKTIPKNNILIGATHTHSAPDAYGFPDGQGGFSADLKYLDFVVDQTVEAIEEAVSSLAPSRIRIATDDAKGKIAFNYYAEQLYDPRCDVIQFLTPQNAPFATLVNYAIHPEVLGSSVGIISPDLVGPLYDQIKAKGGGIGIFMNGAQGGMVTADNRNEDGSDNRTWAECVRIGTLLADEALRIVSTAPVQEEPSLSVHAQRVTFPVESELLWQVMKLSPLNYSQSEERTIATTVNLINVGTAQILTIPGEALPNIGYYLKRNMRGEHNLLFGLTNDAFGYILTKVDWNSFTRYDYISRTSLGEQTGELFIAEALKMIASVPAPISVTP